MPAKPIPRQLRASALAFAVRCSVRDAPPVASPQPADADDEDDALAYDESEYEADASAQPAAIEKSPGERFWSRAQSRRRRRRGRDLDAEEPRASPPARRRSRLRRQSSSLRRGAAPGARDQRLRPASTTRCASGKRKYATLRTRARRPRNAAHDGCRLPGNARTSSGPPPLPVSSKNPRRRTVTGTRVRREGANAAHEDSVGARWRRRRRVGGSVGRGTRSRLRAEPHRARVPPRGDAPPPPEGTGEHSGDGGRISCALRSAALRREAVREARTVDRRRRDHALPAIFAKPQGSAIRRCLRSE